MTSVAASRAWLVLLLVAAYACAFADRMIVAVIGPALLKEFRLTDVEFGLLGGLAFALLYSAASLPIARLADRRSRIAIISLSVAVWSLMTALFGSARSYLELLVYRLGVGLGEAGLAPASHSLLSDTYPAARRASAIAIFSIGAPLGIMAGGVAGGWLAQVYGWRTTMVVLGLPGVALALLLKTTLREPPRGGLDGGHASAHPPSFRHVMAGVVRTPVLRHVTLGAVAASMSATAVNLFGPAYLVRRFGVGLADAGLWFGLVAGGAGLVGIPLGGVITDRAARWGSRWYARVPALSVASACPLYILAFYQSTVTSTLAWFFAGAVLVTTYVGPTYAVAQNLVTARTRASASAVVMMAMNVLGQGVGPMVMGMASDTLASRAFAGDDYRGHCFGATLPSGLAETCARASMTGLHQALVIAAALLVWGAVHYWRADRLFARGDAAGPAIS